MNGMVTSRYICRARCEKSSLLFVTCTISVLMMVCKYRSFIVSEQLGNYRMLLREIRAQLTDIKVPGRKNSVTRVIIFMETVSCFVFLAISCIESVTSSIRSVEIWAFLVKALLVSIACLLRIPWSCKFVSKVSRVLDCFTPEIKSEDSPSFSDHLTMSVKLQFWTFVVEDR
jgi:hypothetical protein